MAMRLTMLTSLIATTFAAVGVGSSTAQADQGVRISTPVTHENLSVYFVRGASAGGPVPLTLAEALGKGSVQVVETGQVNELQIENSGGEEVFIQAGDIVKGGKQDRVLTVSFILAPNSGRIPIASFCVERGRWSARGTEDQSKFASAKEAMPSIKALAGMAAPPVAREQPPAGAASAQQHARILQERDEVSRKQKKVWDEVAATQEKLSRGVNTPVAAPQSASSLQLSLENEKLKEARASYIKALQPAGEADGDIIGYVVAINGNISLANVYPSNGLFRKMWEKQLAAAVTEAIGEKTVTKAASPPQPAPAATEFLANAEKGVTHERALAAGIKQETRDADKSLYNEARRSDGKWIHRSYMAK
jgi:hypothetical protein